MRVAAMSWAMLSMTSLRCLYLAVRREDCESSVMIKWRLTGYGKSHLSWPFSISDHFLSLFFGSTTIFSHSFDPGGFSVLSLARN